MRLVRAAQNPAAAEAVVAHVLRDLALPVAATVAGVWPLPGELDLRPLWHALHTRGHVIVLPRTPPRGAPLPFHVWTPGCAMLPEPFGTHCPDGPPATPHMIFVPLLAFDRAGHRLGYGGGYYDRTLASLPGVPSIGFGFAAQEVASVPVGPHDRALDRVVTEAGWVKGRK
jgi:5-formyltetrahydrofolate cyclo-ligase